MQLYQNIWNYTYNIQNYNQTEQIGGFSVGRPIFRFSTSRLVNFRCFSQPKSQTGPSNLKPSQPKTSNQDQRPPMTELPEPKSMDWLKGTSVKNLWTENPKILDFLYVVS